MPSPAYKIKFTKEQDRRYKTSDEDRAEMCRLYEEGWTQKAIAEKFDISQSAVCYIVSDRARDNLREYRIINPPKRRTKQEAAAYHRELRTRKMKIYKDNTDVETSL